MTPRRNGHGEVQGSEPGWGWLSVAEIAAARTLWETTDMTARDIAKHFTTEDRTVTKNAIVSHANRSGWSPRADREKPPRTLFDRLADLHEAYNRKVGLPPGTGYARGPGVPPR
jgi:hypothetical protein